MWTPGIRSKGTRIAACASDGCGQVATWRLEAGGVGSVYCGDCKRKISERAPAGDKQYPGDIAKAER